MLGFKTALEFAAAITCCSVLLGGAARLPSQPHQPNCRPSDFATKKNSGFKNQTLREGSLRVRLTVGPCVSDDVAKEIVRALKSGRVLNRLPVRSDGSQPELPKIVVATLSMIKVGSREEVPPPAYYSAAVFDYTVEFTDPGSVQGILSGSGKTLFINLRDGQIEVVGEALWMS